MAKRKNGWTEDKIARYEKEGRGKGELAKYKPWLTIQNVPSKGRVHRLKGWKTSRIHHLLSDLERDYFYILDWADNVVDIREQFPLNREQTTQLAEGLGINHPTDQETGTPVVMTTDFLITVSTEEGISFLARTIKPEHELEKRRTMEKFEIERLYWEQNGIDWGIVTEKELDSIICKNIGLFHNHYYCDDYEMISLTPDLLAYMKVTYGKLGQVLRSFDEGYGVDNGTALSLFKYLLATKMVRFDIQMPFNLQVDVSSLEAVEQTWIHRGLA